MNKKKKLRLINTSKKKMEKEKNICTVVCFTLSSEHLLGTSCH